MLISSNISVIIPSAHNQNALKIVVLSICKQTTKPNEIIIVDSSLNGGLCSPDIEYLCLINGINLIYKYQNQSMPGKARNIGLSLSSGNIIAFIDVETIPKIHWLNSSVDTISNRSVEGVWGATSFSASSKFEKLVRDSFFGTLPRKTLPGSVFLRDVFVKTGYFIDWSRAGEDTEWMLRVEVLKIPIIQNSTGLIDYVGLIGSDMTKVMKKWYRNYSTSRNLPHFYPQRLLIWKIS
jgi:glycosyltransferase involved in cell wall biosynthesis